MFAGAGFGELAKLDEVTEEHFDTTFDLNVRGTLFTVQKKRYFDRFRTTLRFPSMSCASS